MVQIPLIAILLAVAAAPSFGFEKKSGDGVVKKEFLDPAEYGEKYGKKHHRKFHSRLRFDKGGPGPDGIKNVGKPNTGGGGPNTGPTQNQGRSPSQPGSGFRSASAFTSFVEGLTASRRSSVAPRSWAPQSPGPVGLSEPLEPLPEQIDTISAPATSGFQSPADLEAAIAEDINDCKQRASSAQVCCGNPIACRNRLSNPDSQSLASLAEVLGRAPKSGGVTDYCTQLRTAAQNSKNVNSGLQSVCSDAQSSCESACQDMRNDYEGFLAECGDCDAADTLRTAIQMLDGAQRSCTSLSAQSAALGGNGLEAAAAQSVATHCQGVTTAQTVPGGAAPFAAPPPLHEKLGSPVTLELQGGTRPAGEQPGGFKMEMQVDASQGHKGYAAGKPTTQAPREGAAGPRAQARAPETQAPKAAGGAPAPSITTASAAGKTTDKKTEAPAAGEKPKEKIEAREPASVPRPIGGNDDQFNAERNLEDYLPQGVRTAMQRLSRSKEINNKEENVFLRISAKFREKCQLGVLWECK